LFYFRNSYADQYPLINNTLITRNDQQNVTGIYLENINDNSTIQNNIKNISAIVEDAISQAEVLYENKFIEDVTYNNKLGRVNNETCFFQPYEPEVIKDVMTPTRADVLEKGCCTFRHVFQIACPFWNSN